jgi:ABC-type phosphate transport system auxiliary subunit
MINYNYILVSNLIFYGMIIFREVHAASDKKRDLRERLRMCQRDLSAANLEKEKLKEEANLKSKLNKQLEDNLQRLEHEKGSLQEKVSNLEKAIFSPSGTVLLFLPNGQMFIRVSYGKDLNQRQSEDQN